MFDIQPHSGPARPSAPTPPSQHFTNYADFLRTASEAELDREIATPDRLRLAASPHGRRRLEVAYAPFEHLNPAARVVLVGLTPGRRQMRNALKEARRQLRAGASEAEAMARAKVFASFSGPMRVNLVAMLDDVGVPKLIGLSSTSSLWGPDAEHAHFTSALRYPVFVDGKNYSGAPDMLRTPPLREQLLSGFALEMAALPNAVFVPLGAKVAAAAEFAAREAGVDQARVLSGLPHPSGANAERIAFFLGRKPREALSAKTNPDKLSAARADIENRIRKMGGAS